MHYLHTFQRNSSSIWFLFTKKVSRVRCTVDAIIPPFFLIWFPPLFPPRAQKSFYDNIYSRCCFLFSLRFVFLKVIIGCSPLPWMQPVDLLGRVHRIVYRSFCGYVEKYFLKLPFSSIPSASWLRLQ